MKKLAKFHVSCFATYPAELELPDNFFNENDELVVDSRTIIRYLEANLGEVNTGELNWVDDCMEDPIYSAEIIVGNDIRYTAYVNGELKTYKSKLEQVLELAEKTKNILTFDDAFDDKKVDRANELLNDILALLNKEGD